MTYNREAESGHGESTMRWFGTLTFLLAIMTLILIAANAPIDPKFFSVLITSAAVSSILFLGVTLIRGLRNES